MINRNKLEILKILINHIKNGNWCLAGSVAHEFYGITYEKTNDLDIFCDKRTGERINELLKNYAIKEFSYNEKSFRKEDMKKEIGIKGYFGVYDFKNEEVEVMAEVSKKIDGNWTSPQIPKKIIYFKVRNVKIPVNDIQTEIEAYKEMGRLKKAEKLKSAAKTLGIKNSLDANNERG